MTELSRPPLTNAATFLTSPRPAADVAVDAFEKANPDPVGVQSQDVADHLERDRRTIVSGTNPAFGLAEELSPLVVAASTILVITGDGVEEHRP